MIYWEENASYEEIYNFLQELITYVFNQYGIDRNKFDIKLHFVSKAILGDCTARMFREEQYENKFHIIFNKKYKSFKVTEKNYDSKYFLNKINKGESFNTPADNNIADFYIFIIDALHEIGHIVQYIRNAKYMLNEDKNQQNLNKSFNLINSLMKNSKEKRAILKNLDTHIDALEYMSPIEKDADKKAYIYFVSILQNLIRTEKDEEFLDHLCCLYGFMNHTRKDYFTSYRKHNRRNKNSITKLNELNLTDVLEELSNN